MKRSKKPPIDKPRKPRNWVAAHMQSCGAGAHRKTHRALRQAHKTELRKTMREDND